MKKLQCQFFNCRHTDINNSSHVLIVIDSSEMDVHSLLILIQERNRTSVKSVVNSLDRVKLTTDTKEFMKMQDPSQESTKKQEQSMFLSTNTYFGNFKKLLFYILLLPSVLCMLNHLWIVKYFCKFSASALLLIEACFLVEGFFVRV